MRPLDFYEVVRIVDSPRTRDLDIVDREGIVTGVPPHLLGIEDDPPPGDPAQDLYAVRVADDGYALARRDLQPTGRRLPRSARYNGSRLRVSVEGEPVGPIEDG